MPRCRFVEPVVTRLALTEGDWIEVKRDLNTGEQRAMFVAMRTRYAPGEMPMVNPQMVTTARLLAYLVAWSFRDQNDKPVEVSAGAIDSLDTRTFNELRDALDAHEAARDRELDEQKKTLSTPTVSDPTLQSVA